MKGSMIFIGVSSVALGAFGAHVMKPMLSEKSMSIFQTASSYHLIYAVLLLALYLYRHYTPNEWIKRAYYCALTGIIFFSGSLYILATRELLGVAYLAPILGPITPIGGVLMIGSWLLLWPAFTSVNVEDS